MLVVVLVAIAGTWPRSVFVAEANGVELADGEFEIDPEREEDRDEEDDDEARGSALVLAVSNHCRDVRRWVSSCGGPRSCGSTRVFRPPIS